MSKILCYFALAMISFTACNKVESPSTEDKKPLPLEENMDKTVNPGDDFFMYCNGAWYKKTQLGSSISEGLIIDAMEIAQQHEEKINDPSVNKFWAEVANIENTTAAAIEILTRDLDMVKDITTKEDVQDAIVKTMLAGYTNLVSIAPYYIGRKTYAAIYPTKNKTLNSEWATYCLQQCGFTYDIATSKAKKAVEVQTFLEKHFTTIDIADQYSCNNSPIHEMLVPLPQIRTRAIGEDLVTKLSLALNLKPEHIMVYKDAKGFFKALESLDPESVQSFLQVYIADQVRYTSYVHFDIYSKTNNNVTFNQLIQDLKRTHLCYLYSHAYAKYIETTFPDRKAKLTAVCEEMRDAFRIRINNLEWMSQTTKLKALEKLDAMVFNVGYPEKWEESALSVLNGGSLIEDMHTLARSKIDLLKASAGKPSQETSFINVLSIRPLDAVGAFYHPNVNSINILPAWMISPLFNEDISDAYNYGIYAVIGHEMTHGFDNNGSAYDKMGDRIEWWTIADKLEYSKRQQLLISIYNNLEKMPYELPGVYTDGTITLGENIADLGGLNIAYDAYMEKLIKEGYKGEALKKQQEKFFQSYANLWRMKNTPEQVQKPDVHASYYARVNGPVMSMDAWYDIYNVKFGDKLYLKPETRARIW